tara:strand:+ start:290 stop:490 length:201 start_codon:yes stop_codon:yes gene_type:complete
MKSNKEILLGVDLKYILNNLQRVIQTKEDLRKKDLDKSVLESYMLEIFETEIKESIRRLQAIQKEL